MINGGEDIVTSNLLPLCVSKENAVFLINANGLRLLSVNGNMIGISTDNMEGIMDIVDNVTKGGLTKH